MVSKNILLLITVVVLLIAIPVVVLLTRQQQDVRSRATAGNVTFKLTPTPNSLEKQVGDTFTVAVSIDAGTDIMDKAALKLTYDPARLRLNSFNKATQENASFPIMLKPNEATPNNPTSTPGTFEYEGATTSTTMSGTINLGTLSFTVIGTTPSSPSVSTLTFAAGSLFAGKVGGGAWTTSGQTLNFQIGGSTLKPDLTINSITVSPPNPRVPSTFVVSAVMANIGAADTSQIFHMVFRFSRIINGVPSVIYNLQEQFNDPMVKNTTLTRSTGNLTTQFFTAGSYQVEVCADKNVFGDNMVAGPIEETNETNNCKTIDLTVSPPNVSPTAIPTNYPKVTETRGAAFPNKVRVFNAVSAARCNKNIETSDLILDYPTAGNNFTQLNNWNLLAQPSESGYGQKFICAQFGYQALGSSNIIWNDFPPIISQTVDYVAAPTSTPQPTTNSTLNNITAHVFFDTNRNGIQDGNDQDANEVGVSLSGPQTRNGRTTLITNVNGSPGGVVKFEILVSGTYTLSLNLGNDWAVTNPEKLTVQLPANANAYTDIGIMTKPGITSPVRTGQVWSFGANNGGSNVINLNDTPVYPPLRQYGAEVRNLLFGKFEIYRVRNTTADFIKNPSNWVRVTNLDCENSECTGIDHIDCYSFGDTSCRFGSRTISGVANFSWYPTNADVGVWLTFINVYDYSNNTKCTGNPYWNQIAGFEDCTGNDAVQTTVIAGQGGPTTVPTAVPTINQCPANATTCWRSIQCSNSGLDNLYCSSRHALGSDSLCNHTVPGPFGDGCTQPILPSITAVPTASCITSNGDANKDGAVNLLDYNIWRDEILGVRTTKKSDFNCDTFINLLDHNIWRTTIIGLNQ